MAELSFGDVTRDHLDAQWDIRNRSFGYTPAAEREQWRKDQEEKIDQRRAVGVYDGDRLVAGARIWDFRHWWLGRQVPMAGIAGVVVSPEYRGRGVGNRLMRGVLERSRELGAPLTALYPATVPFYRHLGYEFGGGRYRFTFPASELRRLGGKETGLRRGVPEDAQLLLDLVGTIRAANRESGPLVWPVSEVRRWLEDDQNFCYIAEDGFVVYAWDSGDLRVDELVAGSEQTLRALWSTVGTGSSIAKSVHVYAAPQDPVHLLAGTEAAIDTQVQRWMFRLVDAPAAFAARGWAPGAELELPLELTDPELPDNAGSWSLRVSSGGAELVRADSRDDALRLNARGLAALYAGTPLPTLRRTGNASGGSALDDARVDAAFAGPAPYMLDYF
jgi:predicted acetyltransferase